ncbi:MAG: hypothetical protein NWQ47_10220 [Crocinitomicaceae bacterium]|nr:hypothetical protein [Crocinitomicaceae bacterium]
MIDNIEVFSCPVGAVKTFGSGFSSVYVGLTAGAIALGVVGTLSLKFCAGNGMMSTGSVRHFFFQAPVAMNKAA